MSGGPLVAEERLADGHVAVHGGGQQHVGGGVHRHQLHVLHRSAQKGPA